MSFLRFFRRKSDLAEEIETHLVLAVADRIERGESPEDARAAAMREFGNLPMVADATRDQFMQSLGNSLQNEASSFNNVTLENSRVKLQRSVRKPVLRPEPKSMC